MLSRVPRRVSMGGHPVLKLALCNLQQIWGKLFWKEREKHVNLRD
jgi:hypothetical protein